MLNVPPAMLVMSPSIATLRGNPMAEKYMVAYAKVVVDKDEGILLSGVFFGGIGDTKPEAELIAKECVNTIRGGTILPRVIKLERDGLVIDSLYDMTEKFERIVNQMVETDEIAKRGRKKK